MPAGMNSQGRIWRFSHNPDDEVGGAQPSGTVVYDPIFMRIQAEQPTQALLEQGLEIPMLYTAVALPGDIVVEQNDQVEVTGPPISRYLGKKFVVITPQYSSMFDARQYVVLTLRRFDVAHGNDYQ